MSSPFPGQRLLYCDHVEGDGEGLFRLSREQDLGGIVAKRTSGPYLEGHARWLKIRNRDYSQWVGREELFERQQKNPESLPRRCTALYVLQRLPDSSVAVAPEQIEGYEARLAASKE